MKSHVIMYIYIYNIDSVCIYMYIDEYVYHEAYLMVVACMYTVHVYIYILYIYLSRSRRIKTC
jgi:hypothetical protein